MAEFDWAELAFGSKRPLSELNAVFIAAPREISAERFTQMVKQYLPKANIVLGLAKEAYVHGFEGQPQFKTLNVKTVDEIIARVNKSANGRKIATLKYFQRELPFILEKVKFSKIVLVNGSWQHVFHNSPAFYQLVNSHTPYELVSPFIDEKEAKKAARMLERIIAKGLNLKTGQVVSQQEASALATEAAKQSFDYNFQTGAVIAKPVNKGSYRVLAAVCNRVVPYQTYAMHHGASRETNFSPPNDLNHYDTVHAEVEALIQAQRHTTDLKESTLFINLLPCPTCARMLTETDIAEIIYSQDHSSGYAVKLLESAGKKVRRLVI
nr:cytidine and deoxycytidylate deaminase zinc-binding region [uncultured bacterium]